MTCPSCSAPTCVLETRTAAGRIKRRRACLTCAARFTTVEAVVPRGKHVRVVSNAWRSEQ